LVDTPLPKAGRGDCGSEGRRSGSARFPGSRSPYLATISCSVWRIEADSVQACSHRATPLPAIGDNAVEPIGDVHPCAVDDIERPLFVDRLSAAGAAIRIAGATAPLQSPGNLFEKHPARLSHRGVRGSAMRLGGCEPARRGLPGRRCWQRSRSTLAHPVKKERAARRTAHGVGSKSKDHSTVTRHRIVQHRGTRQ
jgi:hypothetical protein